MGKLIDGNRLLCSWSWCQLCICSLWPGCVHPLSLYCLSTLFFPFLKDAVWLFPLTGQALDSGPQIFTFFYDYLCCWWGFQSLGQRIIVASLKLMVSHVCRSFLILTLSLNISQMFAEMSHILSHTFVYFLVSPEICIKLNVCIHHYSSQ